MDQGTEPIRQDIDQIRASMTDKMERIEARIKGTVDDTTTSVKRMVDVKHQISEHPWTALGISILAGIALGSMGESDSAPTEGRTADRRYDLSSAAAYARGRDTSPYPPNYGATGYGQFSGASYGQPGYSQPFTSDSSHAAGSAPYQHAGTSSAATSGPWSQSMASGPAGGAWNTSAPQPSKPGLMDQVSQQFGGEIEMLKTAAVSSLVGVIRDTIRQNFPSMHQEIERMRREHGAPSTSTWSGATSSTSYGATSGADYAHSAANNPTHVTGSYETKTGHPEDTFRSNPSL